MIPHGLKVTQARLGEHRWPEAAYRQSFDDSKHWTSDEVYRCLDCGVSAEWVIDSGVGCTDRDVW